MPHPTQYCLAGLVASFGLFYLGEHVFKLDRNTIQTLMYLKLSVAGHMTIFVTRTRGPFWSIAPAPALLAAVVGTQVIAALIAIYGAFMTPIGWNWALLAWVYAIAWFLVNDRVTLFAYRVFDPDCGGVLGGGAAIEATLTARLRKRDLAVRR